MHKVASASVTYGWNRRPVRLLMIASLIQGVFFAWGFYAWQPYFLELLGQDLTWVAGLIAAAVALAMMLGNYLVERLTRFCGRRTTLLLWAAALQSITAIGVGLVGNFYAAVALYLLGSVAVGVWMPVKQAFIHESIPSAQRATIVSFDSLFASAGGVVGQAGLGYLARSRSIATGYIVGGIVTLLTLPVVYRLRRMQVDADYFGDTVGCQSSSAAHGLPHVSGVDAAPRTHRPEPAST